MEYKSPEQKKKELAQKEEKALTPDQAVQTKPQLPKKDEKKAPPAPTKDERVALSPDQAVLTEKKSETKGSDDNVVCLYCSTVSPKGTETCSACGCVLK